jgi:N-acetylmuramoyl-L-alanine amidase
VAPAAIRSDTLAIRVVYPKAGDLVTAGDSVFLFGDVGRGDATLTANGQAVQVHPSGGWIAWLPLPDDTVATFRLVAAAGGAIRESVYVARVAPRFHPPTSPAWIDTTSFVPSGQVALPGEEGIRLTVRAAPGATVALRAPDGTTMPLVPDSLAAEPGWGIRAFGTDASAYRLAPPTDRYVGWLPARRWCADSTGVPMACLALDVAAGGDTARWVWPVTVDTLDSGMPLIAELNDDTGGTGTSDSLTVGRAVPGGTYHWFFPLGTSAVVSGRWNDQVRLQLSRGAVAWVNAADVRLLPAGTPPPGGRVGSVRIAATAAGLALRVPLAARVPFRVDEDGARLILRLYGTVSDINWMQYGAADPWLDRMRWDQPAADETTVTLEFTRAPWGWRARWDGRDLLLEARRPPVIDASTPLAGRMVVLDPGHPPAGTTGPTGLREHAAALAVARKARTLLEQAGARVLLTREDSTPLDLFPRTAFAERHDADVLVSIHANALPDGMNPFVHHGTSVYYFHPQSAALARTLQRALVARLGLRDLGVGRGDYALVRNPWMPSALTEGLFLMVPEQEALMASEQGQWGYARAIVTGIADFLRERAGR